METEQSGAGPTSMVLFSERKEIFLVTTPRVLLLSVDEGHQQFNREKEIRRTLMRPLEVTTRVHSHQKKKFAGDYAPA